MDEKLFGKGCLLEPEDGRDFSFEATIIEKEEIDWQRGYCVEEDIGFSLPFKNQGPSSSCVGQAVSYYVGVQDALSEYKEASAKSVYSQIYLDGGGAYIRDGIKLAVDWGSLRERVLSSYENGYPPSENFMRKVDWLDEEMARKAETLQSKEYRKITTNDIDIFAAAIKNNQGVVFGVNGENNGSWNTLTPTPPRFVEWAHGLYGGSFGINRDNKKYIGTPNSWGDRFNGDWQQITEDWFGTGHVFNPWVLVPKTKSMDLKVEEGKLYLLVEGKKQLLAMGWQGKLMVYDDKIDTLINAVSRTNKWQVPEPVTLAQWENVDKVNGKKEPI